MIQFTFQSTYSGEADDEDSEEDADNKKWISKSFVMLDLPTDQQKELNSFDTPEQIGVLAASHFTKQLKLFTDAVVTGDFIDKIFKLFMVIMFETKAQHAGAKTVVLFMPPH